MKPLKSLSIFFPFYNDAGTVNDAISTAYRYGSQLTNNLEVIALHGGASHDKTLEMIKRQKKLHKNLVIIDKSDNWERYAVIKYGFQKASKEWVFYTDGDLQYSLKDLKKLVDKQTVTGADVVNGFKNSRSDKTLRVIGGGIYRRLTKRLFSLPIRDLECDFRLIRKSLLKKIELNAHNASILLELIKKLEQAGATFTEVKVNHYYRRYGKSTYNPWRLLLEKIPGDIKVWNSLKKHI